MSNILVNSAVIVLDIIAVVERGFFSHVEKDETEDPAGTARSLNTET